MPQGVAGGVQCLQPELPHGQLLAVGYPRAEGIDKLVEGGTTDLRTRPAGQLGRADDQILVAVGLQNVGDGHALALRQLYIDVAVAAGIDDDGLVGIPDDIRVVCQSSGFDPLKQHRVALSLPE
jgi:hypothetical protein